MRKLLALIPLIAIAMSLQACGVKPSPEVGCNFVQNGEQQRVSWGSQVPVVIYIDSSVPEKHFIDIKGATDEWNRRIGREVLKIGGWVTTNGTPQQDGKNIIYSLNTWEPEKAIEQARTTVFWAGDRIYEADIRLNDFNYDFSSGRDGMISGYVDMESLMLHELGHVLGLAHSETPQSVMARSLPSATQRRLLTKADQESIRCEY